MWVKFDKNESMGLVGWGSTGNFWNYEWNYPSGPRIKLNGSGVEQGLFNLTNDQWHHLAVTFPSVSSDLNGTKLFVDGYLVDAPALSTSETVNTGSVNDLKIGSSYTNTISKLSGLMDEVRISSVARGDAWIRH